MTDARESSDSAAFTPEIAVSAVSERRDRVGFRRIFYNWGQGNERSQKSWSKGRHVDTETRREYNKFQLLLY